MVCKKMSLEDVRILSEYSFGCSILLQRNTHCLSSSELTRERSGRHFKTLVQMYLPSSDPSSDKSTNRVVYRAYERNLTSY